LAHTIPKVAGLKAQGTPRGRTTNRSCSQECALQGWRRRLHGHICDERSHHEASVFHDRQTVVRVGCSQCLSTSKDNHGIGRRYVPKQVTWRRRCLRRTIGSSSNGGFTQCASSSSGNVSIQRVRDMLGKQVQHHLSSLWARLRLLDLRGRTHRMSIVPSNYRSKSSPQLNCPISHRSFLASQLILCLVCDCDVTGGIRLFNSELPCHFTHPRKKMGPIKMDLST